jgi:hypothetical protein
MRHVEQTHLLTYPSTGDLQKDEALQAMYKIDAERAMYT